jgi:hypothetical protein
MKEEEMKEEERTRRTRTPLVEDRWSPRLRFIVKSIFSLNKINLSVVI